MNCQFLQNETGPDAAGGVDGLVASARRFAEDLGARDFSYFIMRPPRGRAPTAPCALQASYPDEWKGRYMGRSYQLRDPVIEVARRARAPFRWGHGEFLSRFSKAQRLVFHEARAFGIAEGWSAPVHGPDGEAAVFSLVSDDRRALEDAVFGAAAQIQLFAVRYHDAMMETGGVRGEPAAGEVSAREREALHWTAEGLTTEATAERLGLTPSAVNYHLRNACRKLGASSKQHAAIKALRAGLID